MAFHYFGDVEVEVQLPRGRTRIMVFRNVHVESDRRLRSDDLLEEFFALAAALAEYVIDLDYAELRGGEVSGLESFQLNYTYED